MKLSAADRKQLSKLGAVRIPRNKLLLYIRSNATTQHLWPIMVGCKVNGQDNSLGYIAYKDLGNKRYKQALDKCLLTKGELGEEKTGDLVECIMGM
eukprot:16434312-Heterocapsa_arctica.AAC.1